ncbi:aspartate--tRNA(Asn) ligase [Candidatus Pacearchaeota archaeon]|nr:aspartate--tRNA(Asn) ligase [Candidatus Pacearchaeota archaeon]|tara:strand:+ start:3220 stop:4500 length:1281 start_codon:yes stop_codon:yes gene_type:complete
MERTYVKEALNKKDGEKVLLRGWVHDTRDLKKVRFLVLKDMTGRIQITGVESKTDKDTFGLLDNMKRESAVEISGTVKDSKQAPGGKEILPDKLTVIAEAGDPLPVDVSDFSKTELPIRLDNRFLDLHSKKAQAIFKIQSTISMNFRKYFVDNGFIEFQPPSVIGSSSEGGTELYKLKYFEKDAYLAQSPQLYKQMIACAMEKVVTITPVWRAEKHNTTRHLNESRQMDIEVAFADQMSIMKELEGVVKFMVTEINKNHKEDLETLGLKLKVPEAHYLSYDEICEMFDIKNGEDLSPNDEKRICEKFKDDIVFVHSWPTEQRGFYIMRKGEDAEAKITEGFDALYKGVEISSGGQRIHIPELLETMLKKKGLDPKDFKSYINSFRYGAPPHAGWSIGLERFTQTLLELDNIREAVLWPRDRDRLTP